MPAYRHHVFCCTNRREPGKNSCADRGAEELRTYMKDRAKALGLPETRINAAGCLNLCARGPAMVVYPEGVWYLYKTKEDIDRILDEHLLQGKVVEELRVTD